MPAARHDLIILGGGLAGGLAVLALAKARPELDVALVEPGAIGGNHLWSFFDSDIAPGDAALVEPLIAHRWTGYEVRFPSHRRRLAHGYRTIESERLDAAVRAALPAARIVEASAIDASPMGVTLDGGETLRAERCSTCAGCAPRRAALPAAGRNSSGSCRPSPPVTASIARS